MYVFLIVFVKHLLIIFFQDRKKMENFASKYGITWSQVKTRIMNERKFHKQAMKSNFEAMGIES